MEPNKTTVSIDNRNPKKKILIAVMVLALIALAIFGYINWSSSNKKTAQVSTPEPSALNQFPKPEKVDIKDTNSTTAYANFLALSLESFWTGGSSSNGQMVAHKYYPSTADLKNEKWLTTELRANNQMFLLIKNGQIGYQTEGCNTDQPSSEQNKCTKFVVLADNKPLAKSQN